MWGHNDWSEQHDYAYIVQEKEKEEEEAAHLGKQEVEEECSVELCFGRNIPL